MSAIIANRVFIEPERPTNYKSLVKWLLWRNKNKKATFFFKNDKIFQEILYIGYYPDEDADDIVSCKNYDFIINNRHNTYFYICTKPDTDLIYVSPLASTNRYYKHCLKHKYDDIKIFYDIPKNL